MTHVLVFLLTLLFSLSGPAMGANGDFGCCCLAAKGTTSRAIVPYYPPNQGFVGASARASLVPGTVVDRYGGTDGFFLSPQGVAPWARALSYGAESRPLNAFTVLKPIEVDAGRAASWFNQPGGGMQYDLGTSTVQDLINSGHLGPLQ